MKWVKPILYAIARFLVLVVLPIILVRYLTHYLAYLEMNIGHYSLFISIAGILYIAFKFLEESIENPKYQLVFALIALTFILLWTYYLLNKGILTVPIEGITVTINYEMLVFILIILMALRYPEIFMRYYLELQKFSQKKKVQSSVQESL